MKKKYKKPNICAIFFDVLDLVTTSAGDINVDDGGGDPGDWDDDWDTDGY